MILRVGLVIMEYRPWTISRVDIPGNIGNLQFKLLLRARIYSLRKDFSYLSCRWFTFEFAVEDYLTGIFSMLPGSYLEQDIVLLISLIFDD